MDTFPYESWEEAVEAAAASGGAEGYFTFGPGGNTAMIVLTILGIALATLWMLQLTMSEAKHLDAKAAQLNEKWGI
jgi:hypothetical protein